MWKIDEKQDKQETITIYKCSKVEVPPTENKL